MRGQFLKLFCKVSLSILMLIIATQLVLAAQTDAIAKKQEPVIPDDETIMKWIHNHPINREIMSIKCDFDTLERLFDDYRPFFGKSWQEIRKTKKCEEVLNFCMEKEEKRLKVDLDIITPEKGIDTGNLILYGYYIKPPYKVEVNYEKNEIKVNNVIIGSVKFPRTEKPQRKLTELEEIELESFGSEYKIRNYEKKLRESYKKELNYKIQEWQKKYNYEKVYQLLVDELEEMKREHEIWDYKIYDKQKLLFTFKFYYSLWEKWDLPPEYRMSPEELERYKKVKPEKFMSPEEYKSWESQRMLDGTKSRYKTLIDDLKNDDILNIREPSGLISMPINSAVPLIITLLSEGSNYQKLAYIDRTSILSTSHSSILLFNYNKKDYIRFIKKLILKGVIGFE